MAQAGGFANKPGASSLVQTADSSPAGTPGKQSLVEQQVEGAQAAGEPDWAVRARAYNREHAALCAQFLEATGNACLGAGGEIDPAAIARWQTDHGLPPDGRIGPKTVQTAQGAKATGAGAGAAAGGTGGTAGAGAGGATGAEAGAATAAPGPAGASAGVGEGEQGGFLSSLVDLGRPIFDWLLGDSTKDSGGPAKGDGGGSGGGGGGGVAPEVPVPEHGDDMESPEKVENKKPANAPAKPAGKEVYQKGGLLSKEHLKRYDLDDQEFEFKQRVYDAATARLGDKIYGGVPQEDLVGTENGKQIRNDVAGPLSSMLAAMRADIAAGKAVGDKPVGKATGISVTSAYRSPSADRDLWDSYFQGYLAATTAAREATGDPFGAEAVKLLVKYIGSRKAPPGGSNHSNGTAIDLAIEENGARRKNSYSDQVAWRASWHYAWLNANAASYGFKNYPKEAWHWDYKG